MSDVLLDALGEEADALHQRHSHSPPSPPHSPTHQKSTGLVGLMDRECLLRISNGGFSPILLAAAAAQPQQQLQSIPQQQQQFDSPVFGVADLPSCSSPTATAQHPWVTTRPSLRTESSSSLSENPLGLSEAVSSRTRGSSGGVGGVGVASLVGQGGLPPRQALQRLDSQTLAVQEGGKVTGKEGLGAAGTGLAQRLGLSSSDIRISGFCL